MEEERRKRAVQQAAKRLEELAEQRMVEDGTDPAWRTYDFAIRASDPAGESKDYHLGTVSQTIAAAMDWKDALNSELQNQIAQAVADLCQAAGEYKGEE